MEEGGHETNFPEPEGQCLLTKLLNPNTFFFKREDKHNLMKEFGCILEISEQGTSSSASQSRGVPQTTKTMLCFSTFGPLSSRLLPTVIFLFSMNSFCVLFFCIIHFSLFTGSGGNVFNFFVMAFLSLCFDSNL